MFGLSVRELLIKTITNACYNNIESYKSNIIANMGEIECKDGEELDSLLMSLRREYFDDVANSVINTFRVSSPAVFNKIQLSLMSPGICGYSDINIENGIGAGSVYAICFNAIKNKIAAPKDCIRLNHIQNNIMNEALNEISRQINK